MSEQAIQGPSGATSTSKPHRVLACVLCQQRKIKCDRRFPCANCVKSHVQCVPAATLPPRRRRRRLPERELLDRLRRYESLLRQNNIDFEPLHVDTSARTLEKQSPNVDIGAASDSPDDEHPGAATGLGQSSSPSTVGKSESLYKTKSLWHAMNQRYQDSGDESCDSSHDDVREAVAKEAWNEWYQSSDHVLFGFPRSDVDVSTLHPDQVQIFRLWQIYLDNINPLLKVTHTPTLQGRIIDAASNVASVKPTLTALMFSIYSVAILSLSEDDCRTIFGTPKQHLLTRFQFGCQQALWNCGFLRSNDRECLTALYLYLISVGPVADPHSLSCTLSVAMRIAQRMGIHNESTYARTPILEAEMCRRLWWSLVLFDTRICELAVYKSMMLVPTWDCRPPLNVNDFDLQVEMKSPPTVHGQSTEAHFAVVRSEIGDFIRHSAFHLDFVNPILKSIAKDVQHGPIPEGGELITLEKMIEVKYLRFCNPENPLHFMTIWTARSRLARYRLVEAYSRVPKSSSEQTDTQHDAINTHALKLLECDTKLMTSPLVKGYHWLIQFYFPLPAYIHIVQDLKKRPAGYLVEQSWEIMSANYQARCLPQDPGDNPFFKVLAKIILEAWDAREALFSSQSEPSPANPQIVSDIREKMARSTQDAQQDAQTTNNMQSQSDVLGMSDNDLSMSMPMDPSGHGMLFGVGGQGYDALDTGQGHVPLNNVDVNQLDWNAVDWIPMYGRVL